MAQQTFGRGMLVPTYPPGLATAPSLGTLVTDANDEVAAIICRAPKTGNVRALWSSMTVGSGADRKIGLYTVDPATGAPTSPPTPFNTTGGNSEATKTVAAGDSNDLISSGAFAADCPVVKGDLLAVCWITPPSSPGNLLINTYADAPSQEFPYRALFTGAWAKSVGAGIVMFEYDDGSYDIPLGCVCFGDAAGNIITTATYNSGTNPNTQGARFQFKGPVRCNGAWIWGDFDGNAAVYLVDAAWDGTSGDALAVGAIDSDVRPTTGAGVMFVEFTAAVDLAANTHYRLVVAPSSVTSLSLYYYSCKDAAQLGAQPMGADFHFTTGNNPNDDTDWTNYNSGTFRVPFMGLIIDGISDGAGGGGGHTYSRGRVVNA